MQTDRVASYSAADRRVMEASAGRQKRAAEAEERCEREKRRKKEVDAKIIEIERNEDDEPIDYQPPLPQLRSHKRSVHTGERLFVPHNILSDPAIVSSCLRNNISVTAYASVFRDLITQCGGHPEKFVLGYSSVYR